MYAETLLFNHPGGSLVVHGNESVMAVGGTEEGGKTELMRKDGKFEETQSFPINKTTGKFYSVHKINQKSYKETST